MPKVTFIIDGEETVIEFESGKVPYSHHGKPESFLDLAKHFGVPLEHACGGSCACTTCHVIIKEGEQHLSEMEDDEADRLDTAWGLTSRSRLGFQAGISGDGAWQLPVHTADSQRPRRLPAADAHAERRAGRRRHSARQDGQEGEGRRGRAMKWTDAEDIAI